MTSSSTTRGRWSPASWTTTSDYADDALFITNAGVLHGREGVRQGFTNTFADLPEPAVRRAHAHPRGRRPLPGAGGDRTGSRADDGVETFRARDGEIVLQACTTPR
jgi:hypothetical protein